MKSEDKVKNNLGSRLELKDSRISCTVVAIIVKNNGKSLKSEKLEFGRNLAKYTHQRNWKF